MAMTIDLDLMIALDTLDTLQDEILWVAWHGPRRGMPTADIARLLMRPNSSVRDRVQLMREAGLVTSTNEPVPRHQLTDEGRNLARQLRRRNRR